MAESKQGLNNRVIPSLVEEPHSSTASIPVPILSLGKKGKSASGPSQAQGDTGCEKAQSTNILRA